MILYHYTSLDHLRKILSDKEIRLSASNLLEPIAPKLINGVLSDATDKYKPVVWFTTIADFDKAADCGLKGGIMDKTESAIVVNTAGPHMFYKWDRWAIENGIDISWFARLKQTAPQWNTFYICEHSVPINDSVSIAFRPDIMLQIAK